jgi:hypothetical protein
MKETLAFLKFGRDCARPLKITLAGALTDEISLYHIQCGLGRM